MRLQLKLLAVIGLVIVFWDTLAAYYDKWTRPAHPDESQAHGSNYEYFCPMHPTVIRDIPNQKCPICFMPLSKRQKSEAKEEALPPGVVQSDALPRLEHGSWAEVAGLVVARQRPETAKGFIFVLLEDEAGMVNVIVRPDVYERYRTAVRGEPLLWVRGKLAKDDGTVNVLAEEAAGLKVGTLNAERGTDGGSDGSAFPPTRSAFEFLKSMRRVAPESKDWG